MDPLLRPEFILLRLEQGELPLEGHTIMFQLIAHTTSYPDDALCAFYDASLNASCRAPSSEDGPRADFAAFVEWTLARNKPSFPACSLENLASATPDPEPSQSPPRHAEHEPELTTDGSNATSATQEPSPIGATERAIATELEEFVSDQVREPATEPATVDVPDGREGAEDSTAHCTTAEGEQRLNLGLIFLEQNLSNFSEDVYEDMPILLPPDCLDFPPTLPLSIVSAASVLPPLSPDSPSAHPQPTICVVGSPQVCQSPSVSGLEDPSSSPPASESWTPSRPSDPAAPPRLSAPSSPPSPVGPPAPPGSIVPPAPPWSVVAPPSPLDSTPPAAPCRSVPPALWTSSLPRAQPRSSVAPAPPWTSGSPPLPRTPEPWALRILGVALDHRLSVSASGSTTTCSASVGRPHGVVSPSSTMAPPSIGSTVGFHHGCGLGLTWLLLLQPSPVSSLAPPPIITSLDYSVTTLDSIYCPPPGSPSSAEAPSKDCTFLFPVCRREDAPSGRGR
ncbi:Opioid growth factor receptor [Labeo rohita]|uniref:Opioid growth factor receptor n=1 Tax=Labeo rohita TaxID=84645 RepID=A0ABQ8LIF2_LABRO|nr:Opioid growth factor receptor [Labeo rohita]